jgi:hypothetical protein
MLASLRLYFPVSLIGISTNLDTCIQRVKTRDASIHVDVSDSFILTINTAVVAKKFILDGQIDNE